MKKKFFKTNLLEPNLVFSDRTFEEHCSSIPEFFFKKDVPQDVKLNFEVVHKLLVHSYFEYKFIDEAYSKAIQTFEMAMSIRYKELCNDSLKREFSFLISKLTKLNQFDSTIGVLKSVKETRNSFAHPKQHTFAGVMYWNGVTHITQLINEMYEDVDLRLERREKVQEFSDNQKEAMLNKSLVLEIDKKKTVLYSLQLILLNNKLAPNLFTLAYTPLFDLTSEHKNQTIVPTTHVMTIINPTYHSNSIKAEVMGGGKVVEFTPIKSNERLIPEFETWNEKFEKTGKQFIYESSITNNFVKILVTLIKDYQKL